MNCSPTNHQTREIAPGIILDARRAVWLAEDRTLLVADLHLGYAWAHRSAGNLIPIAHRADALDRLNHLIDVYAPQRVVLLGDIVHDAVEVDPLGAELRRLHSEIGSRTALVAIAGNHDRRLAALISSLGLDLPLQRELQLHAHRCIHGDGPEGPAALAELATAHDRNGFVVCGHEHPAITLSDQIASHAKCPCFVIGDGLLMLPAFSEWAAGNNLRRGDFLSPYLRAARLRTITAIVAGKLLDLPVKGIKLSRSHRR